MRCGWQGCEKEQKRSRLIVLLLCFLRLRFSVLFLCIYLYVWQYLFLRWRLIFCGEFYSPTSISLTDAYILSKRILTCWISGNSVCFQDQFRGQTCQTKNLHLINTLHTAGAREIWIDQSGFSRREKLCCPDVNAIFRIALKSGNFSRFRWH